METAISSQAVVIARGSGPRPAVATAESTAMTTASSRAASDSCTVGPSCPPISEVTGRCSW